jgi:hypothetical protein
MMTMIKEMCGGGTRNDKGSRCTPRKLVALTLSRRYITHGRCCENPRKLSELYTTAIDVDFSTERIVSKIEVLLERKSSGFGLENRE